MPIADFAREWFEDELLRAAIAGPGVSGTMLGPRSAGSTLVMLLRETHRRLQRAASSAGARRPGTTHAGHGRGGDRRGSRDPDRRTRRADRRPRRARRRASSSPVARSPRRRSSPCVDPKTTFLELFDPVDLTPDFLPKMRNYRAQGTVAKVNLALSALPPFRGVTDSSMLTGRIHIGPDLDYLERAFDHAKYGEVSDAPWLDITVPSVLDRRARARGRARDVRVRTLRAVLAARHRLAVDATDAS